MWANLITILLPFLIKIVWIIIEKKENADKLKGDMLKLIDSLSEHNIPIELHNKYNAQIERIRKKLESGDV